MPNKPFRAGKFPYIFKGVEYTAEVYSTSCIPDCFGGGMQLDFYAPVYVMLFDKVTGKKMFIWVCASNDAIWLGDKKLIPDGAPTFTQKERFALIDAARKYCWDY